MGDGNGKVKPVFEVYANGKLELKTGSKKFAFETAAFKLAPGVTVVVNRSQEVYRSTGATE